MTLGEWTYWLGWLGALVGLVCGVWLAWWALFADRANGQARCPKCWFDMSASPTTTCGECGHTPRSESGLYRTKRHYRKAMLGVLLCVGIVAVAFVRSETNGFAGLLPTRVIITLLPFSGGVGGSMHTELVRRLDMGLANDAQMAKVIERCIQGDFQRSPGSPAWRATYGDLILRYRGALEDRENGTYTPTERLLLDASPAITIATPDRWPIGVTPRIDIRMMDWWPMGTQMRITAKPSYEGAEPITFHRAGRRRAQTPYSVPLPNLGPEASEFEVEFVIERRKMEVEDDWTRVATLTESVQFPSRTPIDSILIPDSSSELTHAIRRAFDRSVAKWPSGRSPVRVSFDPRTTVGPIYDDVAIGVSVEIRREGVLARQLDLWWLGGTVVNRSAGWSVEFEDEALLRRANDADGAWTMTVRGDPAIAARTGTGDRYWAGELTFPLRVQELDDPAPEPVWWVDAPSR